MNDKPKTTQQPPVDLDRRRTLKSLGKAAYVAPVVTLISMDSLASPGRACSNFMPDQQNPNC